jgi:hypothetical protein
VTPHRQSYPAARGQDPVHLGHGARRRPPDAAETGHHRESVVVPRQRVHVSDPEVTVRVAVTGDRNEAGRSVDPGTPSAEQPGQFQGQAGPARHVEQPVTRMDTQVVVESDVFPAVGRFADGGERHGLATPAFVDPLPTVIERGGDRSIRHHGRILGMAGPGRTGSSESPRSTRPSPCPQRKSSIGTARES